VESNVNENVLPESPESNETNGVSDKNAGVKNVASGMAGGVVGAAGAMIITGFTTPENTPDPTPNPDPHTSPLSSPSAAGFDGSHVPVASHVTDDMSFSEAFASARSETGAGGVFIWRGGCYGTYYRDEWSQLSPEYKQTFSNYPYQTSGTHAPGVSGHGQGPQDVTNAVHEHHVSEEDNKVEVLGVHYANGGRQEIAFAPVNVDGYNGLFIDVNTDGIFDVVVDNYGNIHDISDLEITHAGLHSPVTPEGPDNYLEANYLPDYTNDANIDSFLV
jgi:hypothetical protein